MSDDKDRRYTLRSTLDLCARLAGVESFDLDVAADEECHHAPKYFDAVTDGLSQPWHGRVWCNPPYSDIEPWVRKANFEVMSGRAEVVAMLLPCNRTEQPWWQQAIEPYRDRPVLALDGDVARARHGRLTTRFLPGRVKFGSPGNREAVGVGSPPFGCVLLVWRRP